jgi:transcriptional regulator with XRE-family HTH domain
VPRINGERLRELRRARGWDVPEMARRMRIAASDGALPDHDALVRMIRRWEREGLNTSRAERYELLYATALGVRPAELRALPRPAAARPAESPPQPAAGTQAPGVVTAIADALHVDPGDYPGRDRAALEGDVLRAWELRQASEYARLGELLTDLLRDVGSRQGDTASAVHAYNLASSLCKGIGAHEMSAVLADRAYLTATQHGSPLLTGAARMRVANVYLAAGRHAEAIAVAVAAASELPPRSDSPPGEIAVFGALVLTAAVAAARTGDSAQAWEFLGHARAATAFCDRDHADLYAVFGPANLAIHGVQVATELGDGREALRRAERADPARLPAVLRERRTTLLIDIARAQHMQSDNTAAGETLLEAERVAPLEVRYSGAARGLLGELLTAGRPSGELRKMAGRLNNAA